jgi:flagellar hook-length control protein FliK
MPTSTMLPSSASSPVSPGKNYTAAPKTGGSGETGVFPGFQAVLAQEMNEKEDSAARLAEENKPGNSSFHAIEAQGAPVGTLNEHWGQNGEVLKKEDETENALLQPFDNTPALTGLETVRLPQVQTEMQALAGTNILPSASGVTDVTDINDHQTTAGHPGAADSGLESLDTLQQALPGGQGTLMDLAPPLVPGTAALSSGMSPVSIATTMGSRMPSVKEVHGHAQIAQAENSLRLEWGNRQFASAEFGLMSEIEKAGNEKSGRQDAEFSLGDVLAGGLPLNQTTTEIRRTAGDFGSIPGAGEALAREVPRLEPRIGGTGWDNALGQKILWMISDGRQIAELNLNPPDLGPLQVILSVTDDQAVAMFFSQQPDVRNALEAALPRLKEMMAENGIQLSGATVGSDSPQQQKGFERHDRSHVRHTEGGGNMSVEATGISRNHIQGGSNLVDTFA